MSEQWTQSVIKKPDDLRQSLGVKQIVSIHATTVQAAVGTMMGD